MGLAQSALPELSRLSVQFTLLPFVMAIWFHNRAQVGWAVSAAFIGWWEYIMRFGVGLQNPITATTYPDATDLAQAQYIYFVVFGSLLLVCSMCGTGVAWLLDLPYPIPAEALLPESPGHVITTPYTNDRVDQRISQQDAALSPDGLNAFGFTGLTRPWDQFLITIAAFILAVALPFIVYEQVYTTSGWGAWLGAVLIALAFHLLFGVYLHFRASLYIYGPQEYNMKMRELQQSTVRKDDDRSAQDPDLGNKEQVYKRTIWNIWKFVLIAGGCTVFGLILFAGLATFGNPPWVDTMYIIEITVIGALLLIVAVIVFIYSRVQKSRFEQAQLMNSSGSTPSRTATPSEETETGESETTSEGTGRYVKPTGSKVALSRAADTFLGSKKVY